MTDDTGRDGPHLADSATADEGRAESGETGGAGAAADAGTGRHRGRRRRSKPRRKAPWWELPILVLLAIVIAIVVKTFVVQPFYIPSGSMEKTLHGCPGCHGDRILVNKPIYDFRDPEPGDIVVFHAPNGWDDDESISRPPSNPVLRAVRGFGQLVGFVPPDGEVLVKRVIATAGETIKGDSAGHVLVSVHGAGGPFRQLQEPYVDDTGNSQPAFGPVTVPAGRLWVMGDHRDYSEDSRFHCSADGDSSDSSPRACATYAEQATVPIHDIIGKAFVIAWPPSRWRTLGTPSTFESTGAAGAAFPGLPALAAAACVLPLSIVRRRRRPRRRARR